MRYLILLLILSGCHRPLLECRSQFLHPIYLASEQVDTPDPSRACFYGQQILIHWRLPKSAFDQPVILVLNLRYGNKEVEKVEVPITVNRGWWIYRLINEQYWEHEGIISFKAELYQNGRPLAHWTHFLWADLIEIPQA